MLPVHLDDCHPLSVIRLSSPPKSPLPPASYTLIKDSRSLSHLRFSRNLTLHSQSPSPPIIITSLYSTPKPGTSTVLREPKDRKRTLLLDEGKFARKDQEPGLLLSPLRVKKATTFTSISPRKRSISRKKSHTVRPLFALLLASAHPLIVKKRHPGQLTGWDIY